jgi:hypothetical protein
LVNQRVWDAFASAPDQINIDNAYVVLKEFLYSPVTVIAGRQDLKYGTGFIVGPGLLADPNGAFTVNGAALGQEHSAYNSYDAIRVILDFAPVTIEGLIAKINETGIAGDDQDLYGALVNYKFDQYNAEAELYWFNKDDHSAALTFADSVGTTTYDVNIVHTIGLRLAGSPMENLWISAEGAGQLGEVQERAFNLERDREAYAATIDVRYTWANSSMTPVTGVGWVYYSGEEEVQANGNAANGITRQGNQQQLDSVDSWDSMYRGQFHTYIQDFLAGFAGAGLYATADITDTAANTNRHLFYGDLSLKPMEDVTLWGRYTHVRFDEAPVSGRSEHAGDEIDVKAKYAYTDDVDLSLGGGVFIPGTYYKEAPAQNAAAGTRSADLAYTIVGEANVKF